MPINFDALQTRLEERVSDGRTNPIGYGGGDLTGVSLLDADVMRSPCRALKWMSDNSPYDYETFVRLSSSEGWQGINIFNKDGTLYRKIEVKMGGGENADPKNQIYINNRAIIIEAIAFLNEELGIGA